MLITLSESWMCLRVGYYRSTLSCLMLNSQECIIMHVCFRSGLLFPESERRVCTSSLLLTRCWKAAVTATPTTYSQKASFRPAHSRRARRALGPGLPLPDWTRLGVHPCICTLASSRSRKGLNAGQAVGDILRRLLGSHESVLLSTFSAPHLPLGLHNSLLKRLAPSVVAG